MTSVRSCTAPAGTLLGAYAERGAFTDCYTVELPRHVTQSEFVEAFYTSFVFKLERWLIATFLSRPATDAQAHQLAAGRLSTFSVWSVEHSSPDQILLAVGATRSWLMASPVGPDRSATRLYFGSAVLPRRTGGSGAPRMGWQFRSLLGFHKAYSRALLAAASRKLAVAR